ncbi:MAG: indolepyruvate ferredoxin oxidoreductase family protein [Micrococcales bacterium]|nr:indolepyruvate ferredoxin oxidoreductase family protein [Micrococcales bacterium]
MTKTRDFRLADRYELDEGEVLLSGLQALVRVPLAQRAIDAAAGLDTRTLISGYEGSPLGGYDLELQRRAGMMDAAGVVFRPAVNEELAANAVQGSQLAATLESFNHDGVVGVWYGKAPGLDRATDAIRHGALGGASRHGGVIMLVGDDSTAKSSTVPSSSETAMAEVGLAVLSPADPQEVLDLSLHGVALSRFSGMWAGIKLATNVVDGSATVRVRTPQIAPVEPSREIDGTDFHHEVSGRFLGPNLAVLEQSAVGPRAELALRYARANGLNLVHGDEGGRVGIITAGMPHHDVLEALTSLGISPDALGHSGIRILKLGLVAPLDAELVRSFAEGLDAVVVVEEKRPFIELAVKDALYGSSIPVWGKGTPDGAPLLRAWGDLPPHVIAEAIAPVLRERGVLPEEAPPQGAPDGGAGSGIGGAAAYSTAKPTTSAPGGRTQLPLAVRTPYFCSGCPHNRSTQVPAGSLVGAGIGCHALVAYVDPERAGEITGLCQMGGEGAAWIGMAPFVSRTHLVQNLGDGTFHHSGSLAVRAAIAAGVHMTYKILYNGHVAMTGGQDAVGSMPVPQLVQSLLAEGAARVAITTDEPERYRGVRLPAGVRVHHRDRLIEVQEELSEVDGVTVLIHDQECATELRRQRKRGLVQAPSTRVFINTRVCEGCGDCGAKSNCLSVVPVDSEFGRKTQINQATCNSDYSCLDGDCPSFLTVEPAGEVASVISNTLAADHIPAPPVNEATRVNLRAMGIGGTGIVTTAQVLAVAATTAGLHVRSLDMMGLSQKGGAVVSDLRLSRDPIDGANKLEPGTCDVYLGSDLLVAADERNLAVVSPDRTVSVLSTSAVPTGAMVSDVGTTFPAVEGVAASVRAQSRDLIAADARGLCEGLFGGDQLANTFLLGMAAQLGVLPFGLEHVEDALRQNGVAVEANLQAFRWGRLLVTDRTRVEQAAARHTPAAGSAEPSPAARALAAGVLVGGDDDLGEVLTRRVDELMSYQDKRYAAEYVRHVAGLYARERDAVGGCSLATQFAWGLHKLMAYKDEYEVARLSTDPALEKAVKAQFGAEATYSFRLHPPMLRALGMEGKMSLPAAVSRPALAALARGRRLRGTPMDPFGRARVRQVERSLIDDYIRAAARATAVLTPANAEQVRELLALPDMVRGYEEIKLANVAAFRAEVQRRLQALGA